MTAPHPYVIVEDGGGRTYVIPRDKEVDWAAWCDTPEPDLNLPDDETDYTAWEVPAYAVAVGGHPDLVTFNLDGTYTIER